jgi:spore germination protein
MIWGKLIVAQVLVVPVLAGVTLLVGGCAAPMLSPQTAATAQTEQSTQTSQTSPSATAVSHPFAVTAYAEAGGTSAKQVAASAFTTLGVDGVNLTADGTGITDVDPTALALLARAHDRGTRAELLVGNFNADLGDFDDATAETMFDSTANTASVVAALKAEVDTHGWDGITVDLEGLNSWGADGHTRDDNAGLARFVHELKTALGQKQVSICLTATPNHDYANYGYDLASIAGDADHIVLMAYDQHGPTWSRPGPIGGLPWVKQSLAGLLSGVPAAQVQLGIAGYGYSWPHGRTGRQSSDAAARALVKKHHATAHWDATQKEWHATFRDSSRIWWSDARSYVARVTLAKSLGLGGVAVWSLTLSDPLE